MEFNRCILLLLMVSSTVLADPCNEYNPIPDIHRRDPVYQVSDGEDPINDKTIVEGWYGDMTFKFLNEAPGFFKCGGHYPLWRSGTTGDVCTICMETNSDVCAETFQIEMKTCNGYEVYYLLKPDVNRASYCFVNNPDAPPPFSVKPYITVDLEHEEFTSKLVFRCNFTQSTEDLFYKTIWYIEGAPVHTFEPAQWTDYYMADTTLSEHILMDNGFKAGISIQCAVRAQYHVDGGSSESELSDNTFVGVKIYHWEYYELAEGEIRQLYMAVTVPFGCGTFLQSSGQKCYFNVEVVTLDNPDDCASAAVVQHSCGIEPFEAESWHEWSSVTFVGKTTSMYGESSGISHLKFKTPAKLYDLSEFWQDYDIGHVAIRTVKNTSSIMYKYCSLYSDPYLRTFDGNWLNLDDVGVYMLYEDESRSIEIQVETEVCSPEDLWWGGDPFCNCGVAVRAGRTVFEISHCDTPVWHIGFTACGDGGDVMIVRRNWDNYQITLPTGTIVDVTVWSWDVHFLNVYVYATALDEGKTRALCGVLSYSSDDDWMMKDGGVTDDPIEFTESWRITKEESLFNPEVIENGFSTFKHVYQYCTCDESTPDKQITCSAMAASEVCKNPDGMEEIRPRDCIIARRKKRMVHTRPRRVKRATTEHSWRNGWNESSATAHCESKFDNSESVQLVKDVPGVSLDLAMKACIADIKASGTNTFTTAAVSSVIVQARREALVNPVLSEPDPDNPSAPTLYDVITRDTCPGDCRGRGTCSDGQCQCDPGYGGGDCSVDLATPPQIVLVAEDRFCDMATKDCLQISVVGNIFSGSEESKCLIEKHMVHASGEKTSLETTSSYSIFESISEVFCSLPEMSEDDVVVSLNVSVSHAGDIYSNELSVLMYDSGCVDVDHSTGIWTLQTGYCVFKGRCSTEGGVRSDNPCVKCLEDGPVLSWQHMTENGCSDGNLHIGENTGSHVSDPFFLPSILVLCHFLQQTF